MMIGAGTTLVNVTVLHQNHTDKDTLYAHWWFIADLTCQITPINHQTNTKLRPVACIVVDVCWQGRRNTFRGSGTPNLRWRWRNGAPAECNQPLQLNLAMSERRLANTGLSDLAGLIVGKLIKTKSTEISQLLTVNASWECLQLWTLTTFNKE